MKPITYSLLALSGLLAPGVVNASVALSVSSLVEPFIETASTVQLSSPSPLIHPEDSTHQRLDENVLLLSYRRRYRFGVRPSRWRRGGFSRNSPNNICPEDSHLIPIHPTQDANNNLIAYKDEEGKQLAAIYETASDHPAFFFHVPALPATVGRLTLLQPDLSRDQRELYTVNFNFNGQAGIIGVQIPDDAPALEAGVEYLWTVSIACNPNSFSDSLTFARGAALQRVPDSLGHTLDPLNYFIEQGIWHDTVSMMANDVYENPEDMTFADEFSNLLKNVGLEDDIANAPIVQIEWGLYEAE